MQVVSASSRPAAGKWLVVSVVMPGHVRIRDGYQHRQCRHAADARHLWGCPFYFCLAVGLALFNLPRSPPDLHDISFDNRPFWDGEHISMTPLQSRGRCDLNRKRWQHGGRQKTGRDQSMARQYSDDQRKAYLGMLNRMDQHWLAVLDQNTEFRSEVYWDLLTGLWRQDSPVAKSEALKSMTSVKSMTTARKYLRSIQQQGWVHEVDHPTDTRFRLVMLSPGARTRLDAFFDAALCELVDTNRVICQMACPPDNAA